MAWVPAAGERPAAAAAAAYPSGRTWMVLAHSISLAASASPGASSRIRSCRAAGRAAADHARPEEVQLAQRGGVKGGRPHLRGTELAEPPAHLPGRPHGEGE